VGERGAHWEKRTERREEGEEAEHRGLVAGGQPPARRIAGEGRESLEREIG
jgi:hypothetical protein